MSAGNTKVPADLTDRALRLECLKLCMGAGFSRTTDGYAELHKRVDQYFDIVKARYVAREPEAESLPEPAPKTAEEAA